MFTNSTLLALLLYIFKPKTVFLDTFFPGHDVSNTADVAIDVRTGKRRLAPFVSPLLPAPLMERRGFTTNTFRPPYIKEKFSYQPADFFVRMAGELAQITGLRSSDRMLQQLSLDTVDALDNITRREEWMAVQALTTGQVPIVGAGVSQTLDFGMPSSHKIVLSGAALWTDSAATPLKNIRTWRRLIQQDSGRNPDTMIMGSVAFEAFLANPEVVADFRAYNPLLVNLQPRLMDNGANFVGRLLSVGVDVYQYDEWYVDPVTGVEAAVMPDKMIVLGARNTRCAQHYGAIQDVDAGFVPMETFPKTWKDNDPSAIWSMWQSAPLPVPHEILAFLNAQVTA